MSALFALADSIIGRLSFAAKIALLVVLFLVPTGYVGSLQFVENRSIAHASLLKSKGLDYLVGVRDVYEKVPQHRGLSQAVLKGNEAARSKLDKVREEVDARFAKLFELDKVSGKDLASSAELERLHHEWTGLRERNASLSPPDSFAQHTALITGLADLMSHVADHTGLNRDTDLATTFSTKVLVGVIPEVADEVRTLAGRKQHAIQEIQQMIERLQQGTRHAVQAMQEGQKQADISVGQSESATAELASITEGVERTPDMSSQSAATEEINQSVTQIDHAAQSTHEATSLAEQTSSELHQRAEDLLAQSSRFRVYPPTPSHTWFASGPY